MTPNQLRNHLRNALDLLHDQGILHLKNPVVCARNGNYARVSWPSPAGGTVPLGSREFATVDEYCAYLENRLYCGVLFDGALLQISFDFWRDDILAHRLCYYPCPFTVDLSEWQLEPVLDVIDYFRNDGERFLRLQSPIRFDFNCRSAATGHPASHVHLIRPGCRCPVVAPISVGHFLRFVFASFYPELLQKHEFLGQWSQELGTKTITAAEEKALHFACQR